MTYQLGPGKGLEEYIAKLEADNAALREREKQMTADHMATIYDNAALRDRVEALDVEMHNLLARWEIVRHGDEIDAANFCIDVMDGLAALASQPEVTP